jgi:hypothetical protein
VDACVSVCACVCRLCQCAPCVTQHPFRYQRPQSVGVSIACCGRQRSPSCLRCWHRRRHRSGRCVRLLHVLCARGVHAAAPPTSQRWRRRRRRQQPLRLPGGYRSVVFDSPKQCGV